MPFLVFSPLTACLCILCPYVQNPIYVSVCVDNALGQSYVIVFWLIRTIIPIGIFLHYYILMLCYTQTRQKNLATYPVIVVSIRKARDSAAFSTITAYWSLAQNFIFVIIIIFIFAFIGSMRWWWTWSSDANSWLSRRSCNWPWRWKDKRATEANKLLLICFSRFLPEFKRSFIEDSVWPTRTNVWNCQRNYRTFD